MQKMLANLDLLFSILLKEIMGTRRKARTHIEYIHLRYFNFVFSLSSHEVVSKMTFIKRCSNFHYVFYFIHRAYYSNVMLPINEQ